MKILNNTYDLYVPHIGAYVGKLEGCLCIFLMQSHTEGGGWGVQTPPPEILKALQNRAKLNPIVKTVKNC